MESVTDVLICGEDSATVQFLTKVLAERGFAVEAVPHASKAIAACLRGEYKMAIVSLSQPVWSSSADEICEPFRILHQLNLRMPVVVVCDEGSLEVESRLREEGVFYFLTKPLSAVELSAAVGCAVRQWEKNRLGLNPQERSSDSGSGDSLEPH